MNDPKQNARGRDCLDRLVRCGQHFSDEFLSGKKVTNVIDHETPASVTVEFEDGSSSKVNGLIAHKIRTIQI